jgi:hypothetical protein
VKLKDQTLLQHIGDKPRCWYRENITSLAGPCHVEGCGIMREDSWHSEIQNLQRWYGKWENYQCDYMELLDTELQYCINHRRIVSIQTEGDAIGDYIGDYIRQRLAHIRFFDAEKNNTKVEDTLNVTLDTLNATYLMGHGTREQWKSEFKNKPPPKSWEERYWVESMYISSERSPYVTAAKAEWINQDAQDLLTTLGYRKISAFGMSAAFTFDSATQMDGLHIIGPPMKMIVTKLFHYMCKDYVNH